MRANWLASALIFSVLGGASGDPARAGGDADPVTSAPAQTQSEGAAVVAAPEPRQSAGPKTLALKGDPAFGDYLAGECVTCHQASGGNDGIPPITGWPEADFVAAMLEYKMKERTNPAMQMIAGRLAEEQIAALAAYFAILEE